MPKRKSDVDAAAGAAAPSLEKRKYCSDCGQFEGFQHRPSCHRQGIVTAASDYREPISARSDTERLDWLLRLLEKGILDLDRNCETGRWFFQSDTSDADYGTARAAIDAELDYEAALVLPATGTAVTGAAPNKKPSGETES